MWQDEDSATFYGLTWRLSGYEGIVAGRLAKDAPPEEQKRKEVGLDDPALAGLFSHSVA